MRCECDSGGRSVNARANFNRGTEQVDLRRANLLPSREFRNPNPEIRNKFEAIKFESRGGEHLFGLNFQFSCLFRASIFEFRISETRCLDFARHDIASTTSGENAD